MVRKREKPGSWRSGKEVHRLYTGLGRGPRKVERAGRSRWAGVVEGAETRRAGEAAPKVGKVGSASEGEEEAGQLERGLEGERECGGEDGGGEAAGRRPKMEEKRRAGH